MRVYRRAGIAIALLACISGAASCTTAAGSRTKHPASAGGLVAGRVVRTRYDQHVLRLDPVLYLTLGRLSSGSYQDLTGHGHDGRALPSTARPGVAELPDGAPAAVFNGLDQYVEVASSPQLSVPHTGALTVEVWLKPATLQFAREEGSGYAYVLGKGAPGEQEYALRMYSYRNSEVPPRPNRISAYAWNAAGGEGSGSYFQDPVHVGTWIMVTFVIDDRSSRSFPDGFVAIYENGRLRGQTSLNQFHVRPTAGNAPLRIATRNLGSFFAGAIGNVAVYDYALTSTQIRATYQEMFADRA